MILSKLQIWLTRNQAISKKTISYVRFLNHLNEKERKEILSFYCQTCGSTNTKYACNCKKGKIIC